VSGSAKQCPHCGDAQLVRLSSEKLKWCGTCRRWIPWDLEPGQVPLVGPARTVGGGV